MPAKINLTAIVESKSGFQVESGKGRQMDQLAWDLEWIVFEKGRKKKEKG